MFYGCVCVLLSVYSLLIKDYPLESGPCCCCCHGICERCVSGVGNHVVLPTSSFTSSFSARHRMFSKYVLNTGCVNLLVIRGTIVRGVYQEKAFPRKSFSEFQRNIYVTGNEPGCFLIFCCCCSLVLAIPYFF